ncbi:molybdenum cofactor guanylyltransferase [Nocardioides perillae]|uniref:Molybdopterin-guanine dinucleotide biosynthesis protein A n=1 Tax=Nocardioides perillae TaxID=1119534 RepID=A0A7Y9URE7_9ACTN|nr:molybdopterin-guanine dinucleotide biosynthesis protein A [Nocardioides perillae]
MGGAAGEGTVGGGAGGGAGDGARGFCVVVLAGGTGARLGGADKGAVEVGGRTLLEHALAACADADEVVVVGPTVPTTRPVTFTVEEPARGGPVAGLLAGRDALARRPRLLGVLAVDMPRVGAHTFARLRAAATGRDGAFLHEPGPTPGEPGRRQLAGVVDLVRLDAVAPPREERHGAALHRLLAPLDLAAVTAERDEAVDVDTWADLRGLRAD